MARRSRLDAELVRRGLARSREHAVTLIAEGRVAIAGQAATKPATGVEAGTPVVVRTDPDQPSWVSRGAHKLLGALDAFGVPVEPPVPGVPEGETGGETNDPFADLEARPVAEHVDVFEAEHDRLQSELGTIDRV